MCPITFLTFSKIVLYPEEGSIAKTSVKTFVTTSILQFSNFILGIIVTPVIFVIKFVQTNINISLIRISSSPLRIKQPGLSQKHNSEKP